MNINDNETMDILLATYLLGEATAEEEQKILQWLSESAENKQRFYEFRLIWNESKKLEPAVSVDVDNAWDKFQNNFVAAKPAAKTIPLYRWMRAAAVLLLLTGGSFFSYQYLSQPTEVPPSIITTNDTPQKIETKAPNTPPVVVAEPEPAEQVVPQKQEPEKTAAQTKKPTSEIAANKKEPEATQGKNPFADDCKTKKFICNSTPCPIEICIIQKNNCETGKAAAIFNCSIIQPDEAGRLCYKAQGDEKLYANCALVIQEIRIKRVSTGETIVLTPHSQPLSAQEAFSYITGQKKGDIVAGVFQNDCNDMPGNNSLTIDNQYGSLLFR